MQEIDFDRTPIQLDILPSSITICEREPDEEATYDPSIDVSLTFTKDTYLNHKIGNFKSCWVAEYVNRYTFKDEFCLYSEIGDTFEEAVNNIYYWYIDWDQKTDSEKQKIIDERREQYKNIHGQYPF